eukprot:6467755-Amphidinium_carterae.2
MTDGVANGQSLRPAICELAPQWDGIAHLAVTAAQAVHSESSLTPPKPKASPAHPTNGLDRARPGAASAPAKSPGARPRKIPLPGKCLVHCATKATLLTCRASDSKGATICGRVLKDFCTR